MENTHKLYRSRTDRVFAGVCGGLGHYFDIEPLIFRAVFLVLTLGGGAGLLLYILLAILIPYEPGNPVPLDHAEAMKNFAEEFSGRAKNFASEVRSEGIAFRDHNSSRRNTIGLIIVVVGIALLLNQIFPAAWFRWDFFWPTLLIIIGIAIIAKRK